MPRIENLTMTRLRGRTVRINFDVRWSELERVTNYRVRYEFWEQDSGRRGANDFLTPTITLPMSVPPDGRRPETQSFAQELTGDDSWDNEWGKDEVYCIVRLVPIRTAEIPESTFGRSNVISARF